MSDPVDLIRNRLKVIHNRIEQQERLWRRELGSVKLVAVSKGIAPDTIATLISMGQRSFAENRFKEAVDKWQEIKRKVTSDVELRFIGRLQSNKVRLIVSLFDVIETIDDDAVAAMISAEMSRLGEQKRLYVQVSTGLKDERHGMDPREVVSFVERCRVAHGLEISGLMCIPPRDANSGPHFALLNKLAKQAKVLELSMGMSEDFETAIAMGATHLRIGRALFDQEYSGLI